MALCFRGIAQSTLPLRADTVVIEKVGGSAELKLKNKTRDTLGVLTNIGNGVTAFIKPQRYHDTCLIIGRDTICGLGAGAALANAGGAGDTLLTASGTIKRIDHDATLVISTNGNKLLMGADTISYVTTPSKLRDTAAALRALIGSGGTVNLDTSRTSTSVTVLSPTGTDALIKEADTISRAGVLSVTDKRKIDDMPRVFNVVRYGATTDSSSHDDCPAIQAAVQAAFDAGGGVVYFPAGHYTVGCALQHSVSGSDPDAQIVIPLARDTATHKPRILFEGEYMPNFSAEIVTTQPRNRVGVIIESTILDTGYVFGSAYYSDLGFGGDINWTWAAFKNIEIRVRSKTSGIEISNTMSGINSDAPRSVDIDHVKVTTQSSEGAVIEPYSGTVGIRLPHYNNNANIIMNEVVITGFYNGLIATEHLNATELIISTCHNGVYLIPAFHSAYIAKYTSEGCVNHVYVSNEIGAHGPVDLHIGSYNFEHFHSIGAWNAYAADVTYADTSSNCRVFISYRHAAESGVGKVSVFNTNAPQRVKYAFDGVSGESNFLIENFGNYRLNKEPDAGTDRNIFHLGSTTQTGGFLFGSAMAFASMHGPYIGGRGNTYSANSGQRGLMFIGSGTVSSPTGIEGNILFSTQDITRLRIGYSGSIFTPYISRSASTTDSSIYLNPSTGEWEYRKISGSGSSGTLQNVTDNGSATNDSIVFLSKTTGTNRDVTIKAATNSTDNLAEIQIYPQSGSNVGTLLSFIPRGTGFSSGLISGFTIFGTDYIADPSNFDAIAIRRSSAGYILNSNTTGTGTLQPIKIQMNGSDALTVATNGDVSIANDDAYDASTWNGNTGLPTKNALRDKLESIGGGNGIYGGNGSLPSDVTVSGAGNDLNLGASGDKLAALNTNVTGTSTYNSNAHTFNDGAGHSFGITSAGFFFFNGSLNAKVERATDANTSVTTSSCVFILPAITANRTLSLPATARDGMIYIIINTNSSGNTWQFGGGGSLVDQAGAAVTTFTNANTYTIMGDNTANVYRILTKQ